MAIEISPSELGKRVASFRKERSITQDAAAQRLGVSRPTYIAMEKGVREFRPDEIMVLAEMLGKSVHDLVTRNSVVTDFAPQFRVTQGVTINPLDVENVILQFKKVCNDYVWLEDEMKKSSPRRHEIDEYPIEGLSTSHVAEDVALLERNRLGLGLGPISDLVESLETEAGLRIFVLPITEFRIAGMFVYSDRMGGCVLINGSHPATRQTWSLAHEYGHFLTNRYYNEITVLIEHERKPRAEQFADYFAASFLMPAAGLWKRFSSVVQQSNDFVVADLCELAEQYGVSVEAMTRRLERLGCIPNGTWDGLSNASLGSSRVSRIGMTPRQQGRVLLPKRFVLLAVQAFEQERITETRLAELLRCKRVEARGYVESAMRSDEVDPRQGAPYQLSLKLGDLIGVSPNVKEVT